MKTLLSIAAVAAVIAATVLGLQATPGHAATTARHKPECAVVTIGFKTATGHEADEPLTFCGLGVKRDHMCYVTPWGPMGPGAKLSCTAVKP